MDYFELSLRWIHILAAVTAAGGIIFWRFVLIPTTNSLPDEQRRSVLDAVRGRWSMLVSLATAALLVTGLFNAVRIIQQNDMPRTYHNLVMVKLVLALAFFYLVARLSGRSESAARFRERLPFWTTVALMLVLGLVLVAGYMKNMPHRPKTDDLVTKTVACASFLPANSRGCKITLDSIERI